MDPVVSVQTKLLRKRRRACKSSWSRIGNQKVIYTEKSLEFGKYCEELSWNHCTSTSHRSETDGFAERAVRRIKEGTSAVLLQSGLHEQTPSRLHQFNPKVWPDIFLGYALHAGGIWKGEPQTLRNWN